MTDTTQDNEAPNGTSASKARLVMFTVMASVFMIGVLVWMFLYWLSGNDFPDKRGFSALFYLAESIVFGSLAVAVFRAVKK